MGTPFRTVEYRGSSSQQRQQIVVPNGQAALDSAAAYDQRQLQSQEQALLNNNQAQLANDRRLDAISQQNAQLAASQMASSNEVVLRGKQMLGQQRLDNRKLSEDQQIQLKQLSLTHQIKRDEMTQMLKRQETESLTQFGAQMIQFSQTLWKQKAEDINKKNEELEAIGQLDKMIAEPVMEEILRVDQAEWASLNKAGQAEMLATRLEAQGLPNEAARIRAANPFYMKGFDAMTVMMGVNQMPDFIRNFVDEAHKPGKDGQAALKYTDPDYSVKLQATMYEAAKTFLIQSGLTKVNPVLASKYMREGMLETMAGIARQHNSENNKQVKDAQKASVLGQILISAPLLKDPAEASKAISNALTNGVPLDEVLKGVMQQASLTGDDSAVVGLMSDPRMAQYTGDYAQWEKGRRREAEAALEKQNEQNYKDTLAEFKLKAANLNNQADIIALKDEFRQRLVMMPEQYAASGIEYLDNYDVSKAGSLAPRLRDLAELNPAAARQLLEKNGDMLSGSARKEIETLLKNAEKGLTPEAEDAFESAKLLLNAQASPKGNLGARGANNEILMKQIGLEIKRREGLLEARTRRYWLQPGANIQGYREWLASPANKDLFAEIKVDTSGQITNLGQGAKPQPAYRGAPPVDKAAVQFGGTKAISMLNPDVRQGLLKGEYRDVNIYRAAVLAPVEVLAADKQFGETGVYPPEVLVLAHQLKVHPSALLRSQANIHGIRGDLSTYTPQQGSDPAPASPAAGSGPVTRQQAIQRGMSLGLSPRGAIWFATNMMDESSGNPSVTHDGGDGLGLFGHQGSRLQAMRAYAASRGVDVTNGSMQLDFALNEIKTGYRDVWNIITSPNPSLNDLWRASKTWEGFSESVYEHRYNSLKTQLGE